MLECFILHTQDKILLIKKLKLSWDFRSFCLWEHQKKQNQNFRLSYIIFPCIYKKNKNKMSLWKHAEYCIVKTLTCKACTFLSSSAMYWSFLTRERWANCLQFECFRIFSLSVYELIGFIKLLKIKCKKKNKHNPHHKMRSMV